MEEAFVAANKRVAIAMGEARGVAFLAAAEAGLAVFEYSASEVKQAVSGYGRGSKEQVQEMLRLQLGLEAAPQPNDASDALATALCHLMRRRAEARLAGSSCRRDFGRQSMSPIACLRGVVEEWGADWLLVFVGGVGLRLQVPASTAEALGRRGESVVLHTHLHLRDDAVALYGFASAEDLRLFEMLISVSGVGPRGALSLLSALGAEGLSDAVSAGDAPRLQQVPGVGQKMAARLVLELKGKLVGRAVQPSRRAATTRWRPPWSGWATRRRRPRPPLPASPRMARSASRSGSGAPWPTSAAGPERDAPRLGPPPTLEILPLASGGRGRHRPGRAGGGRLRPPGQSARRLRPLAGGGRDLHPRWSCPALSSRRAGC